MWKIPHVEYPTTRREFLCRSGAGFGAAALAAMLAEAEGLAANTGNSGATPAPYNPLAPKQPHFKPRAKSVIFLFMEGGPSHIDTFDPKPLLNKLAGQPLPESFGKVITAMGEYNAPLLESKRKWKQHGEAGTWVSDWLPEIATCVDDIAVIRSCWANGINHSAGVCQMNTCSLVGGRPSLGSWVSYGLGTENADLPAFVVMQDNRSQVVNGPRNWSAGFMPAVYQGTRLQEGSEAIPNLKNPEGISAAQQRSKLDFLNMLNRNYAEQHPEQSELEARIASYELAFRMQAAAPEAIDLSRETEATHRMYGLDQKETAAFGRLCLLARRLVERGVRFVQLYHGAGSKWDAHSNIESNHSSLCKAMDLPVAGLLRDLKQRGLLDQTLVVWGGEFGRTPMSEKGNGRDHNPTGFTMWMAGGGVKGGQTIGTTDELGLHAVEDRLHVTDIHASILHLLGLDNMKLTYLHKGRPERPTVNEGSFFKKLVG